MNRKFCVYIILLVLIIPGKVDGQRWKLQRYEAAIGVGTTHPFMDIGSTKDALKSLQITDTRVMIAPHIGFKILDQLTVKLDLNYLMIGGADSDDRERAYTYTSNCFEPVARVDYLLFTLPQSSSRTARYNKKGMINNYGSGGLYIFAGVGGILSKAKVNDANGDEPLLNPYYHNNMNFGVVIPTGFGYKISFSAYFDMAFEIGGRFSFTDLIEGYWNTDASNYNDRYIVTSFKGIYKISNDRQGKPTFSKRNRYGR